MPNYVKNRVRLSGGPEAVRAVMESVRGDGFQTIDFNKIVPMPEELNIEAGGRTNKGLEIYRAYLDSGRDEKSYRARNKVDPEFWALGRQAYENTVRYGAPTWYEWCVSHWGTKWNAVCEQSGNANENILQFQTAWSAPHPILERLAQMHPGIAFEHEWADEDFGANCGRREYSAGRLTDEYFPHGAKATEFALSVWELEPEEIGLSLNAAGTEYVCTQDREFEEIEILGSPALFADERLTAADVPRGLYCCHLRHTDDGLSFCTVEPNVWVNHGGTVITREPLDFGEKGYIPLTEETDPNFTGKTVTFDEFLHSSAAVPRRAEPGPRRGPKL